MAPLCGVWITFNGDDAHADIDQLVAGEARGMIHDDGLFLLIECGNPIFSRNGHLSFGRAVGGDKLRITDPAPE
jgi:hypothetical protein